MKTQITETSIMLWLDAEETWNWAMKPGGVWPNSRIRGQTLFVEFDSNGVAGYRIGSPSIMVEVPTQEINAITSDHLCKRLSKDHPLYFITVGQFDEKDEVRQ